MATARPRPQVMRLTDAAAMRIKDVMARADKPVAGVRVGVKNGGCAGMEYTMEYADSVKPTDEVVEDKGVKIMVDPKAVLFLLGTEMDYKTEKLSAQFIFNNPQQTRCPSMDADDKHLSQELSTRTTSPVVVISRNTRSR
jgi:iron-sulfur cluster assembly protein